MDRPRRLGPAEGLRPLEEGRPLRHDQVGDHRPRNRLARRRRELYVSHPGRAGQGRRRRPGRLRPQNSTPSASATASTTTTPTIAPVNEFWNEDRVTRLSDGQWRTAWARCYNPKPARAVEFEARLAPIIQEKFHLDTAYCDVHTAVAPWDYVRLRRPGAAGRHLRRHLLRLRRDHAAPEEDLERPGLQRGQQPLVLLRLDRRQLRPGPGGPSEREPLAGGFRPAEAAPAVLQLRHGEPGDVLRRRPRPGRHTPRSATPGSIASWPRPWPLATRASWCSKAACPPPCGATSASADCMPPTPRQTRRTKSATPTPRASCWTRAPPWPRTPSAGRKSSPDMPTGWWWPSMATATETWKTPEMMLPPNGWYVPRTADGKLIAWSALIDGHRADYVRFARVSLRQRPRPADAVPAGGLRRPTDRS